MNIGSFSKQNLSPGGFPLQFDKLILKDLMTVVVDHPNNIHSGLQAANIDGYGF